MTGVCEQCGHRVQVPSRRGTRLSDHRCPRCSGALRGAGAGRQPARKRVRCVVCDASRMVPSRAARHVPVDFVAVDDGDWAARAFHAGPHPAGSVVCAHGHHVRPHGLPDPSPVAVAGLAAGAFRVSRGALEGDLVVCASARDAAPADHLAGSAPAGTDPATRVRVDAGVLSAVTVDTWESLVACLACAGIDTPAGLAGLGWWALHGRFDAVGVQGVAAARLGCNGGLWVLRAGVEVTVGS